MARLRAMANISAATGASVNAPAGVASGTGLASDPTLETGTPLSPGLLEIASLSVMQSAAAAPGSNDELHGCLVAILCAHAALEARMNEAADGLGEWWDDRERQPVELKWADLVERLGGTRPLRRSPVRAAVARLTLDRNRIAHFRGVPMPDGRIRVSGPPDKTRGGITQVRGYFDTTLAAKRLEDAKKAIEALT